MSSDKSGYVEVVIEPDERAPANPSSPADLAVDAAARTVIELRAVQKELAAERQLVEHNPYKHGKRVLELQRKEVELALRYRQLAGGIERGDGTDMRRSTAVWSGERMEPGRRR